jgi:hypothetical protein
LGASCPQKKKIGLNKRRLYYIGGNALILNAGEGYTAYLWNDGTTGKNLIVTTTGTYTVTVTDGNGCHGSDGIHVEFHEVPGPVLIKHN